MATITIQTTQLKRVEVEQTFDLPEEVQYIFFTGIRQSVCLIPEFSTWKWQKSQGHEPEQLLRYKVIAVDGTHNHVAVLTMDPIDLIPRYQGVESKTRRTGTYAILDYVESWLKDQPEHREGLRTRERFLKDLFQVLNGVRELAGLPKASETPEGTIGMGNVFVEKYRVPQKEGDLTVYPDGKELTGTWAERLIAWNLLTGRGNPNLSELPKPVPKWYKKQWDAEQTNRK